MLRHALALTLVASPLACKTVSEGNKNMRNRAGSANSAAFSSGPLFSLDDVMKAEETTKSATELKDDLVFEMAFRTGKSGIETSSNEDNSSVESRDTPPGCDDAIPSKFRIVGQDTLEMGSKGRLGDCLSEFVQEGKVVASFKSHVIRSEGNMSLRCEGADFSALGIQTISTEADFAKVDAACKGKTRYAQSSSWREADAEETYEQGSSRYRNSDRNIMMGKDGPCVYTPEGDNYRIIGCYEGFINTYASTSGTTRNTSTLIALTDILQNANGDMLEGRVDFMRYYGWTGFATVKAGASTFSFEMRMGDETITGEAPLAMPIFGSGTVVEEGEAPVAEDATFGLRGKAAKLSKPSKLSKFFRVTPQHPRTPLKSLKH